METCVWIFTASLFITDKTGNNSACPSVDEWLKKLWSYPYYGLLLSNTKEQPTETCYNLHESPENYAQGKKPIPNGFVIYDSIYTVFFK